MPRVNLPEAALSSTFIRYISQIHSSTLIFIHSQCTNCHHSASLDISPQDHDIKGKKPTGEGPPHAEMTSSMQSYVRNKNAVQSAHHDAASRKPKNEILDQFKDLRENPVNPGNHTTTSARKPGSRRNASPANGPQNQGKVHQSAPVTTHTSHHTGDHSRAAGPDESITPRNRHAGSMTSTNCSDEVEVEEYDGSQQGSQLESQWAFFSDGVPEEYAGAAQHEGPRDQQPPHPREKTITRNLAGDEYPDTTSGGVPSDIQSVEETLQIRSSVTVSQAANHPQQHRAPLSQPGPIDHAQSGNSHKQLNQLKSTTPQGVSAKAAKHPAIISPTLTPPNESLRDAEHQADSHSGLTQQAAHITLANTHKNGRNENSRPLKPPRPGSAPFKHQAYEPRDNQIHPTKNEIEAPQESELDHDIPALYSMSLQALQSEKFDVDRKAKEFILSAEQRESDLPAKMQFVFEMPRPEQAKFLASLDIDEWEEAGDWFLEKFGETMTKFKTLRREKRKAALDFETQIADRHRAVEKRQKLTEDALTDMKDHGRQVLSGTPRPKKVSNRSR